MTIVVSPSSLGEWKAGSPRVSISDRKEPELSEGTVAIKPLAELRNGSLSPKARIKHLSSPGSLGAVQHESLAQFLVLRTDSPKQRCPFPLIHGTDVC